MNQISKGKVLKFKTGYNPNSSSVGSQIPLFFAFISIAGVCTVLLLHSINKIKKILTNKNKQKMVKLNEYK